MVSMFFFSCTKNALTSAQEQNIVSNETKATASNTQARAAINEVSIPSLHPCGVAVSSKTGKVAICTYEGDQAPGKILVWNTVQAFINKLPANGSYFLQDPEAVAFDTLGNLFISCTTAGRIYYTSTPLVAPTKYIYTPGNIYNPRGLAFDKKNRLIALYEGQGTVSAVYRFDNPLLAPGIQPASTLLTNITDPSDPLYLSGKFLGVSLRNGAATSMKIYLTNVAGMLSEYTYFTTGGIAGQTSKKTCATTGLAMDVATNGSQLYYTTMKGNVGQLYSAETTTSFSSVNFPATTIPTLIDNVCVSTDGVNTAWGVAVYNNYILVAAAPENKVKIYAKQ
jgi:hypothetical protein